MSEPPDFSFLDSVIEEIWQGKRVLLAPPGTGAFVATNVAFTIGAALVCAAILPEVLQASPGGRGLMQLTGIALLVPQVVVPAVMVARGRRGGRRILTLLLDAWLLLAGAGTLLVLFAMAGSPTTGIVSTVILALARYGIATRSYLVFTVFQERMGLRRESRGEKAGKCS
jgi:hypothetical protein